MLPDELYSQSPRRLFGKTSFFCVNSKFLARVQRVNLFICSREMLFITPGCEVATFFLSIFGWCNTFFFKNYERFCSVLARYRFLVADRIRDPRGYFYSFFFNEKILVN